MKIFVLLAVLFFAALTISIPAQSFKIEAPITGTHYIADVGTIVIAGECFDDDNDPTVVSFTSSFMIYGADVKAGNETNDSFRWSSGITACDSLSGLPDEKKGKLHAVSNIVFYYGKPILVNLLSFTAKMTKSGVEVEWRVTAEINHAGYRVSRSNNGQSDFVVLGNRLITESSDHNGAEKIYRYTDPDMEIGRQSYYLLTAIDLNGREHNFGPVPAAAVTEVLENTLSAPATFSLHQNYPNPFNPSTTICYTLPTASTVTLKIYDATGRKVQTLFDGVQDAGEHSVLFQATDLPSGVYIYKIEAGEFVATKKMNILK